MTQSHLGTLCVLAVVASSGAVMAKPTTEYDPMALDTYIASSLAAQETNAQAATPQNAAQKDGKNYIIGPDGKRILLPMRTRWRVGVFR